MKVGDHQGSALSPLLFIMLVDLFTEDVRNNSLCRRSCFVWGIIKCGYGQVCEMEKCNRRKGSEGEYR